MQDNRAIQIISGFAILAATTLICVSVPGGCSPRVDTQVPEAVGSVMARQTLALLQPGGQVVVITRDTTAFQNPATDIQLASFKKTLGKTHAASLTTQALEVDPLRPVEVPSGDFQQLIRNTPKGSVIVSFMGPPLLSPEQTFRLGEIKPAIVAFCSGSWPKRVDLRVLFEQGLLKAAVVSRDFADSASPPKNSGNPFEQQFLAVTSTNLTALTLIYGAPP